MSQFIFCLQAGHLKLTFTISMSKALRWLSFTLTKHITFMPLWDKFLQVPIQVHKEVEHPKSMKRQIYPLAMKNEGNIRSEQKVSLERIWWKARRQGQTMLQTSAVPSDSEQAQSSQIQRALQQMQTDKSETKGTLRLWKVILEQDKEVRTQKLWYVLHWVKRVVNLWPNQAR